MSRLDKPGKRDFNPSQIKLSNMLCEVWKVLISFYQNKLLLVLINIFDLFDLSLNKLIYYPLKI